jgi:hypothetical protein
VGGSAIYASQANLNANLQGLRPEGIHEVTRGSLGDSVADEFWYVGFLRAPERRRSPVGEGPPKEVGVDRAQKPTAELTKRARPTRRPVRYSSTVTGISIIFGVPTRRTAKARRRGFIL